MDIFRLLLPSILSVVFLLTFIWIVAYFIRKSNSDKDVKSFIWKSTWLITLVTFVFYIFYVVKVASVNEIPRSVIDRSVPNQSMNNFEQRMENDTSPKNK